MAYRAPPQISAKQNFRQCGGNACAANQCGPTCGIRDLVTLPGHFLRQGYDTIGNGPHSTSCKSLRK